MKPQTQHSINPYTGTRIASFREHTPDETRKIMNRAARSFQLWRRKPLNERSALLLRAAGVLESRKEALAGCITEEMGKPLKESLAEIEKCSWVCRYYSEKAKDFLADEPLESDGEEAYLRYDPIGVVLGVMPWNYPFWQVFRFAAPTLTAGNTALLKHASNVWKCAEQIASVFREAGYPEGAFQVLNISSEHVSDIIENPSVQAVSLTGSTPAGAAVASKAGSLIKKSVLELGGNNALVVFDDADLEHALETCLQARFQNTGQSCIAGKRLLLQKSIAATFREAFCKRVEALQYGDPMELETEISVMAREDLAETLHSQMQQSVQMGARILVGGTREGTFFAPTVLEGVRPGMPVFDEETFGPLIGISVFETEPEALKWVAHSDFGLGVSIFTRDRERISRLLPELDEGAVFVNSLVRSDPRWPFGGVKTSGFGRELSKEGIREFVNIKTVCITS